MHLYNMNKYLFLLMFSSLISLSMGQQMSLVIEIEKQNTLQMNGIQSYAIGTHQGKCLIIGGRVDGLHRRQPFAAFDEEGNNKQVFVVNLKDNSVVSASINLFPENLREQLQSTNMQFYQQQDLLFLVGGYGYSASIEEHTTYSKLIVLQVSKVIEAIENKKEIAPYIFYFEHPYFQVAGGRLESIYEDLYLVGGHKFLGAYNPLDPDHGPGFTQEYSNRIFRFKVYYKDGNLLMDSIHTTVDSQWLHRRDYNVAAQILPNGQEGLTAFSGVFQTQRDLPFLHSVSISKDGMFPNDSFYQHYNHYHCANIGLFSDSEREMHTLFFGGIAQYYDSAGILIQDNNVPFVKTIARVTRKADGSMHEYKIPTEMPDYLGAGSEFIKNPELPSFANGVLKMDALSQDSTYTLGYILGGIKSSAANIFWENEGDLSEASNAVYKVSIRIKGEESKDILNTKANHPYKISLYPNYLTGDFDFEYSIPQASAIKWGIYTLEGKKIFNSQIKSPQPGQNFIHSNIPKLKKLGTFEFRLQHGKEQYSQVFKVE